MFDGDRSTQESLADQVIVDINSGVDGDTFNTGSDRFNSEWKVAFYQMAALGLSQMVLQHPELKARYRVPIETCLEQLLTPETLAFGKAAWGKDAIADLKSNHGHAYIGYTNLALSLNRQIFPDSRFNTVNDQITAALARRLAKAPHGILETYPFEAYPPDQSAVIGSIALYNRVTKANYQAVLDRALDAFKSKFIDPESGMVVQAVSATSGKPQDQPRASGTTLSVYFLSFADPALAKTLHQTISTQQQTHVFGLTGILEYPPGQSGKGDVDSGPLLMGASPSASVFAIGGAKRFGDHQLFTALYRSLDVFGSFSDNPNSIAFQLGGPLGKAILLAMCSGPQNLDGAIHSELAHMTGVVHEQPNFRLTLPLK